jgi:hypothetical protein
MSLSLDCFSLTLSSYEMDLSVQWFESLGLISWNFTARTIVFVQNGHQVCWQAIEPASSMLPLLSIIDEVLEDPLRRFEGVFDAGATTQPLNLATAGHDIGGRAALSLRASTEGARISVC